MNPTVAVLIRTKNEAQAIGRALDLVQSQTLPAEIIVVDSGSSDRTVEIVKQYAQVRLIEMPASEFTFGRSLNLGCAATEAEIVVPLSAHAFPCDRSWLSQLVRHFADPQVAGVYGRQLPHPDAYPPVERDYLGFYGTQLRVQSDPDQISDRTFSNANAAIRRSCWQQHPFNESLSYSEDQVWAWAMLEQNYKIIYEPEAKVFHSHNETLQQVFRRSYREAVAAKLVYDTKLKLRSALIIWVFFVLGDTQFIVKHHKDYCWLIKAPIYRLFCLYGQLVAD